MSHSEAAGYIRKNLFVVRLVLHQTLGFRRVSETQKRSFYETSEETYELMTHSPEYGRFGFRNIEAVGSSSEPIRVQKKT